MTRPDNRDQPFSELIEYFGDLYNEIAHENANHLHRSLERIHSGHELNNLKQAIELLVNELAALKADMAQLRLETLSNGANAIPIPMVRDHRGELSAVAERPRSFELSMGSVFSGRNWHNPEIDIESSCFRWSGPGEVSTLDLLIDRSVPLVCEIVVGHALDPSMMSGLRVFVNGEELSTTWAEDESKLVVTIVIPVAAEFAGLTELKLHLGKKPVRPSDFHSDSDDERLLGLMVYRVRVFPLSSQEEGGQSAKKTAFVQKAASVKEKE